MGYMKREMEALEVKRDFAYKIAIDAGVLRNCAVHDCYYRGKAAIQKAYKLGESLWFTGALPNVYESPVEMKDCIKRVVAGWEANECSGCAKAGAK
jgi:hypothetical protein